MQERWRMRFIEIHGGRTAFEGLSTGAVCSQFLLPYTATTKLSLVEHVRQLPDGHLYAKPATWFVSHAWSYLFLDVVDALTDFFQENDLDESLAVWFCTFCNNQHAIQDQIYDFEHWFGIFRSSLRAIGNVVMVMSPWNDPVTLKRTWCVFEVYASVVENARFEIAMGRSQKASLIQDIQVRGAFHEMLSTIKSDKSETTVPSDRDGIFRLIRDEVGFVELDRMVFDVMEKWMFRSIDHEIDAAPTTEIQADWIMVKGNLLQDKGEYAQAKDAFQTAYEIYRRDFGEDCPDTWKALAELARSKLTLDHPLDEIEVILEEVLRHDIRLLSKDHEDTLASMNNLGGTYSRQGKFDIALPLLMECYERRRHVLGEEHQSVRNTMAEISIVLDNQNRLDDSLEWSLRCFELQTRVCGADHPDTGRMQNNLAMSYLLLGNFTSALPHLKAAHEALRRSLGPAHLITLMTQANLGNACRLVGDYTTAEEILLDSLEHDLSSQVVKTRCLTNMGLLWLSTCQYDKAMACYKEALDITAAAYGRKHPSYARSLPPMFTIKMKMGCFEHLEEIAAFEMELVDTQWTQDSWKDSMACHGCRREIHGKLFACSQCPPHALRFCHACIDLNKPASYCKHGADAIESTKPPQRYLHEQRLHIMAKNSNWVEYEQQYAIYRAYCDDKQVAESERLAKLDMGGTTMDGHLNGRCCETCWFL
ncbi:hypothetical protein AeRB84_011579 [Aphanomyces euteiches]|nr:hypothetical protein AeRB84_011579 [Aphanomyces euteiches]